jgi:hypothetical protein
MNDPVPVARWVEIEIQSVPTGAAPKWIGLGHSPCAALRKVLLGFQRLATVNLLYLRVISWPSRFDATRIASVAVG